MTNRPDRTATHHDVVLTKAWAAAWPLTSKLRRLVRCVSTESAFHDQRLEARELLKLEGAER